MPNAPRIPPTRPPAQRPPRGSTTARGYGVEHQRIRARLIAERPTCERCGVRWSKHLHHRDRNTANRADGNLEMLCEVCHQAEHK